MDHNNNGIDIDIETFLRRKDFKTSSPPFQYSIKVVVVVELEVTPAPQYACFTLLPASSRSFQGQKSEYTAALILFSTLSTTKLTQHLQKNNI